jgi:glycosyltransferase involved in cell wall biosynthesis
MRVSVVIPTYQRAALVERAVRSVLAQTVAAHEIVVVDDGSTDGTAERLREAFPHGACPQVRLEVQGQRGVSAARNRGIGRAAGDWIALLDSDDEWLPTKLERQIAAWEAAPEHRAVHCDEIWIRHGARVNPRRRYRKAGGRVFELCLPLAMISPSTVLLEAELLRSLGGFDEDLPACEDYDLWLRLSAREPVLYVDEPLVVRHGGRADQLSRRTWGLDRFRIEALEKALRDPVLSTGQRTQVREELRRRLAIVGAGARKRGRTEMADGFARRLAALDSRAAGA